MAKKKTNRGKATPQHSHQAPLIGKINPRLNKMLAILRRRGKHTIQSLSDELEISYDTAKRSLKRLRNEYGMPIQYDRATHRLKLLEKVAELPGSVMVPLSASELRVGLLGAKALLTTPESGLGQMALKLYEKLAALVPEVAEHDAEEILTFGFTSKPKYRKGILKKLLDFKQRRRQVNMEYETPPGPPDWRVVDIYECRVVNEMYYMIGYCHKQERVLTFAGTRIWTLKETGDTYEVPAEFNLKKFLKGNFGIVGGGRKGIEVVVSFKERAYLVKERKWSGETKQVVLPDGSVELHLRLRNLWEFERWVKGHPGSFSVLQPLELRCAVSAAGLRMHLDNRVEGDGGEITNVEAN